MSQKIPPLAHFTTLNPSVYLHRPPPTSSPSKDPDLVLLLGWMSATPRHLSKYTAAYEKLYPSSTILAVTTMVVDAVFSTTQTNLKRIDPVLEVLYSLPPDAKVLLHFFSNGGLFTAVMILNKYREKTGKALNIKAMVLDSTPGRATYTRTIRAMAVSLPKNRFVYLLGEAILGVLFFFYRFSYFLRKRNDFVEEGRQATNDKRVVGEGRRLYVYSKEDDMVDWKAVEDHAREAKERGFGVRLEMFKGSGHAAHMLIDGKRYWGSVEKLWSGAEA